MDSHGFSILPMVKSARSQWSHRVARGLVLQQSNACADLCALGAEGDHVVGDILNVSADKTSFRFNRPSCSHVASECCWPQQTHLDP